MPGEGRGGPAQSAPRARSGSALRGRRMRGDLVQRTVGLCRELRSRGMTVTTAHAMDAVRALRCGSVESRERAYLALRCVLVARPEEVATFDEVFAALFAPPPETPHLGPVRVHRRRPPAESVAPSPCSPQEVSEGEGDDAAEE